METPPTATPRRKTALLWLGLIVVMLFMTLFGRDNSVSRLDNDKLFERVRAGSIVHAQFSDSGAVITRDAKGAAFTTMLGADREALVALLLEKKVAYSVSEPSGFSMLAPVLVPLLFLLVLFWMFNRSRQQVMQQLGQGPNAILGNRAKQYLTEEKGTPKTFADVIGMDETIEDCTDVVRYLQDPAAFAALGARLPRGLLLTGAPGCGKTLLAKAIAGEAKVPFFSISGSQFVEMFVGVGAGRVRAMFDEARAKGKAIIFIDEIDAVGRRRGSGLGGGHDEREQTLNQLLVEMDGFTPSQHIVILAATNRPDVLDPALLRPGRFDRQAEVIAPDRESRRRILALHSRNTPLAEDVDFAALAVSTVGMTGAGLEALINEAALLATRESAAKVSQRHLQQAHDKVLLGSIRKNVVLTPGERELTAQHEIGHAALAWLLPHADAPHRVTITPRGKSLGVTMMAPEEDRRAYSGRQLEARLCVLYGGLAAEELHLGGDDHTTGPADDLRQATRLAHAMVTKWGFGMKTPRTYETTSGALRPLYGTGDDEGGGHSDQSALRIDEAVATLLDRAKGTATALLRCHAAQCAILAGDLLAKESLDTADLARVLGPKRRP